MSVLRRISFNLFFPIFSQELIGGGVAMRMSWFALLKRKEVAGWGRTRG